MHDELRAAAQRGLAGRVHVADDHVRRQPLLEQRVGAAVDGDDHRAHVADERAQRAQVALVADAADDDERRAVAEVGREARQLDPAGEQLALLAHVLDRVVREALERLADLLAARLGLGAHALEVEHLAAREQLALAQHLRDARASRRARGPGERITSGSPSESASNSESSGRSTSRIPASTSSCGPRFG